MQNLRRALVWLRRIRYCRGFGVQSPWAYRLIRYVLNEHYPYYAYDDLQSETSGLDAVTRKLCRLYLRLANYCQAQYVLDYASPTSAYAAFLKAGCRKSQIIQVPKTVDARSGFCNEYQPIRLLRMGLVGDYSKFYESILPYLDEKSVVILEQIYQGKERKRFWESVINDFRTGVTFDLYYCGIIFFDKSRYKENYIVNF